MTDTIDCHYEIEGDGPPLILIHGIGAGCDAWRFMRAELARHFTVVCYDLRGHGQSPAVAPGFGLDELVNDLERVRERCGFDAVHLAGHSLGGMIGPAYARRHPTRVCSLGLLSTAAFRTDDDAAKVWAVVDAMTEQGIPEVLPRLSDRWFTDDFIARRRLQPATQPPDCRRAAQRRTADSARAEACDPARSPGRGDRCADPIHTGPRPV